MIFLDAMAAYLAAWSSAFWHRGRALSPLTLRRLVVLVLFPFFLLLQLFHWSCLALDELLFPAYRRTPIRRPVFILGVPRSGTTFLHRELARDTRFSVPRSWQLVLAPAICQRRVIAALARIDGAIGAPLRRLLEWTLRRMDGGVSDVHPIGLDEAEEDYLALLPAAGCFFALLCFPHAAHFRALGAIADLDDDRRNRLLSHYHRLLQRQVYADGHRQLLSKNAAFASWAPFLRERYPDATFVLCIRDPDAALASQLRSLAGARTLFASLPADRHIEALFAGFHESWWQQLARFVTRQDPEPLLIEQEWMRGHTHEVLDLIRQRLSQDPSTIDGAKRAVARPPASSVESAREAFSFLKHRAERQRGASGVAAT